ncbi:MAG: hypothetical protein QOE70_1059 [Chthoniobacter sp.]|jgi:hypothetical protein|nr:hypothetical protein [Chthoniobacter sp.]
MSLTVCLSASSLYFAEGGGHLWLHLNWALGFRALGCEVFWLELALPGTAPEELLPMIAALRSRLEPYGLADSLVVDSETPEPLPAEVAAVVPGLERAATADFLLTLNCGTPAHVVNRFRRSAFVDIDPGLLQIWVGTGELHLAPHDHYFTIGETVGTPEALFPDLGLNWHHLTPPIALDWWPVAAAAADAPFTTVSNWDTSEWIELPGCLFENNKKSGFLPFLDVPRQTVQPLELALCLADCELEEVGGDLRGRGWRVRHSYEVTSTPALYQQYIQSSRGEFSACKPSCVQFQNAWVSDRTICYLASGKPAIVRHTGASRILPDRAGMLRFHTPEEAVRMLAEVAENYAWHSQQARALAEEHFDARTILRRVLEVVLS